MRILIVESRRDLGALWQRHLQRQNLHATHVLGQTDAINFLRDNSVDVIILDLVLDEGCSLAISDFASFRQPDARVIFVTNTTFFSDGSIFAHARNACAYIQSETPPDDLAAMVEHYASPS